MKLLLIFFLFLKGHYTFADEFPNLFGCFCEGGLITGVAGKNDKILIDGVEIKTFENGEFIVLETEHNYAFSIEDIDGIPRTLVPSTPVYARITHDSSAPQLGQ